MKQPLHKLIDTTKAVRTLRPEYQNCPGCAAELILAVRLQFLIGDSVQCSACGLDFSWKHGTPWSNRQVEPEQAAAFLLASKLTDDKEALALAAGVPVASVRLWLRD